MASLTSHDLQFLPKVPKMGSCFISPRLSFSLTLILVMVTLVQPLFHPLCPFSPHLSSVHCWNAVPAAAHFPLPLLGLLQLTWRLLGSQVLAVHQQVIPSEALSWGT